MGRIVWWLRQLLPLAYVSRYKAGGEQHFAAWKMWLGRCYAVRDVVVKDC